MSLTPKTLRKEIWLRVDLDTFSVQLAIVSVDKERVLVDNDSLEALFKGGSSWTSGDAEDESTWYITYPVAKELLEVKGFKFHDYYTPKPKEAE